MRSIFLAFFLLCAVSYASNDSNSLSVGLASVKFDYTETSANGALLDTEKSDLFGKIGGIRVEYSPSITTDGDSNMMLKLKYSLDRGRSAYKGFIIGSGAGYGSYSSTTLNTVHDLSVAIDETRQLGRIDFGLNAGVGYRLWVRELSSAQKEDYKWLYWKIGGQIGYDVGQNLHVGIEADYKSAISPKMKAYGSSSPISDTFKLGKTDGYSIAFPIRYAIGKSSFVKTIYSYDYWKITKSDVIGGYYEPDSKTKNQTVAVYLGYKW